MSILNLPNDILWLLLEKVIYDHTILYWKHDLYSRAPMGISLDVKSTSTINEIVKLKSVCHAFKHCIHKNTYTTPNKYLHIIQREGLLR